MTALGFRGHILLFLLLLVSPVSAWAEEPLQWMTDLDSALARARVERKVVLLHLVSDCRRCEETAAKFFASAAEHEPLVHGLRNLILVRTDRESAQAIAREISRWRITPPTLMVIDPIGDVILAPRFPASLNMFAGIVAKVRDESEPIVRASEFRREGALAESLLVMGSVYLNLEMADLAAKSFAAAAKELEQRGEQVGEQYARIQEGFALYAAREYTRGETKIQAAIRNPRSAENEAEAWYALGAIRRMGRSTTEAVRAYRQAYTKAPPHSRIAEMARVALESLDKRPLPPKEGRSASVRVIGPARRVITGSTEFVAEVNGASQVDFYLDGIHVTTVNRAPYRARVNLGDIPRARTIKAVARDAGGAAIGEGSLTVNDRADAFHVRITRPTEDTPPGDVVIEADVRVPAGRKLTELEIFWKDQKLASFIGPPFRVSFRIPQEFGYLRAVGTLDDGTIGEATRVFNATGVAETVDVQGVTILATVLDDESRQVPDLTAGDFQVLEDGRPVTATVRGAGEAVTVGVAIDISSSMRSVQLDIIDMTLELIDSLVSRDTKVFLVAFDTSARLIHPASNDRESLRLAAMSVHAAGGTSLFDGIIFALQQFQGVGGKKALLVVSDGKESASQENAAAAIRLAKSSGAPIYSIVPKAGRLSGNVLSSISDSSGGLFFYAPPRKEWGAIFERIAGEIRGQYVISFVSPRPGKSGAWRDLRVTVARRGARVRTLRGYFVP